MLSSRDLRLSTASSYGLKTTASAATGKRRGYLAAWSTYTVSGTSVLVNGEGPPYASVMIVGEAPGEEEARQGRPFVGPSGYELDRMLGEAGIARAECYVTNIARERPPNNDIAVWIAQSKKEITEQHTQFRDKWVLPPIIEGIKLLIVEMEAIAPNVVIALGGTSLWVLTGKSGIQKWRASMLSIDTEEMKRCL